ncbi:MAG: hypothetical protein ABS81_04500 [Pseudonocardia sp. SCN 72-86]|nr:MAG: hypothetical protein ABS81_04500 [Pseudonocardia sp. SCN 72-86]
MASIGLGVFAAFVLVAHGGSPADAHETIAGGAVTVVQTLGPREVTLMMFPPANGPAAMPVLVSLQGPALDAPLSLRTVPAGSMTAVGGLDLPLGTGRPASGSLQIDRAGPWEIVLTIGPDVSRVPVSVPDVAPTPGWAWAVRGGMAAAVLGAIGAAATRRRRRLAFGLGGGALVGASVAVTAALLSTTIPAAAAVPVSASTTAGAGSSATGMAGMDMSGSMSGTSTSVPSPGAQVTGAVVVTPSVGPTDPDGLVPVELALTDGSTGEPVDDLVVHDDALIHLAVIGPNERLFHVHPARVSPGRYVVRLPLTDAGRYGVFAETVRADGGHQVSRSAFTLAVAVPPVTPQREVIAAVGGSGARDVAGMHVDVAVSAAAAARTTRVTLTFADANGPVRDLQAWLGMGGHLLVLGPSTSSPEPDPLDPATSFAHVHDMDPPVQGGFGPTIAFDYVFPSEGDYRLWAQVAHHGQLVTIPVSVAVTATGFP